MTAFSVNSPNFERDPIRPWGRRVSLCHHRRLMSPAVRQRVVLLWVVFAGGGVLMALEILSSRILAPRFGNSVYVWGSIISVFLAALSAGYWWGGREADRDPSLGGLGRMVVWAGVAQAVVVALGPWLADVVGARTGAAPWGPLLAAGLLFAPPSVLLATLSPYAVRLAARDLARIGHTAGTLYAVSTAGSLIGTLGCTFLMIPFLPLGRALGLVLAVTAATALVALAGEWRRRRLAAATAVALLVLAVTGPPRLAAPPEGLVAERATAYQTLRVIDRGGIRYLESDGVVHGAVERATGEVAMGYPRVLPAAWLLAPDIRRVLILGLGGGNVAEYLLEAFPGTEIHFVEIDPAVAEMARRHMGLAESEAIHVHEGDARQFLERHDERWDLILADTYIGLSVPFHLTTVELVRLADSRLAPGGVFAVNLAAELDAPFPQAIARTVAAVFPTLDVFAVPGRANRLLFATHGPALSAAELAARAERLGPRPLSPDLEQLAALRVEAAPDLTAAPVLTDAFAPVDRLIHLGARPPG